MLITIATAAYSIVLAGQSQVDGARECSAGRDIGTFAGLAHLHLLHLLLDGVSISQILQMHLIDQVCEICSTPSEAVAVDMVMDK